MLWESKNSCNLLYWDGLVLNSQYLKSISVYSVNDHIRIYCVFKQGKEISVSPICSNI